MDTTKIAEIIAKELTNKNSVVSLRHRPTFLIDALADHFEAKDKAGHDALIAKGMAEQNIASTFDRAEWVRIATGKG